MKSNIDYTREFVICGSGRLLTRKEIRRCSLSGGFINVLSLPYGFLVGGTALIISLIMFAVWLIFTISLFLPFAQKENQTDLFFLFNGLFSGCLLLMLLLLIVFSLSTMKTDIWIYPLFTAVFALFLIAYFVLTFKKIRSEFYKVKNEKHKNKSKNKKTSGIFSIIVTILTILILEVFLFPNISEDAGFILSAVSCLFLLSWVSLGTINLAKYYYVKKYKIEVEGMTNFFKNYN